MPAEPRHPLINCSFCGGKHELERPHSTASLGMAAFRCNGRLIATRSSDINIEWTPPKRKAKVPSAAR